MEVDATIDVTILREAVDDDADELRLLVEIFVEHTDQVLIDLGRSLDENDLDAVQKAAHMLKGSALTMGAPGLSQAAAEVEGLAHDGRTGGLGAGVEAFGSVYTEVRAALHQIARDAGRFGFE